MGREVKRHYVKVPGSTANLGPGFDTLGMAVDVYLHLKAEVSDKPEVAFSGEGEEQVEKGVNNLIYKSYRKYFSTVKEPFVPVKLSVHNEIPFKRGLGSSSAAIVGGLLLARKFAANKISKQEILNIANSIEGHPDNVAPALMGGMTACCVIDKQVVVSKINIPDSIKLAAIIPDLTISTKDARNILPESVPFRDAVFNVQRVSLLVNSLNTDNVSNLRYCFQDKLHQDYRKQFVPGFDEMVKRGMENGALGVYLSGSGPTIIAVCRSKGVQIVMEIGKVLGKKKISYSVKYLTPVMHV